MRVIRALHELDIEAVAVYSTDRRDRSTCACRPRGLHRPRSRLPRATCGSRPSSPPCHHRLPGGPPRLGLPGREPGLRPGLRRERPDLRRPLPRGHGPDGRQGLRPRGMGAAGIPLVPGTAPVTPPSRRDRRASRLPGAAEGGGRAAGGRACGGSRRPSSSRAHSRRPRPRPRPRSATGGSTWRRRSCRRATSRSRCSATATAASSRSASASARSSAATRS